MPVYQISLIMQWKFKLTTNFPYSLAYFSLIFDLNLAIDADTQTREKNNKNIFRYIISMAYWTPTSKINWVSINVHS